MKYDNLVESEKLELIRRKPAAYFKMGKVTDEMTILMVSLTTYSFSAHHTWIDNLLSNPSTTEEIIIALIKNNFVPARYQYSMIMKRKDKSLNLQIEIINRNPELMELIDKPAYDLQMQFVYNSPKIAAQRKYRKKIDPALRIIARILSI